jgi:hypothetical protein
VQGVIFTYDPNNDTKTKIKEVPDKEVLARIEGNWQDKIYYTLGSQPFNRASVCLNSYWWVDPKTNVHFRRKFSF